MKFSEAVELSQNLTRALKYQDTTLDILNGIILHSEPLCEHWCIKTWQEQRFITNHGNERIYNKKYKADVEVGKIIIGPSVHVVDKKLRPTLNSVGLYLKRKGVTDDK